MESTTTIAAIATPPGEGAIGIIRLSGPRAFAIAQQVFRRARGDTQPLQSHRVYYGTLHDPQTGELLDRALMIPFRAPHSYTGEDVVELSCHGSPHLLRRVLAILWRLGAEPAQPGEFTQRAFLNGKLDLAQAEAVADLIRARTDAQRRSALALHEGVLSRTVRRLNDEVLGLLATVEAVIDFSEEIGELEPETLAPRIENLIRSLEELLARAQQGRMLREGVRVAIVGRPNVGKSSLLNALLGEERAIVTPIPGTTRDLIEESFQVGGVPFVVQDTAGLRESGDPVEQIGIERTRRAIQSADILLVVLDLSEGLTPADSALLRHLPDELPKVLVWNKCDLVPSTVHMPEAPAMGVKATVALSALTGQGVEQLLQTLLEILDLTGVGDQSLLLTHQRHIHAVQSAHDSLQSALQGLLTGSAPDLIAVDLRSAWLALGEITGDTVDSELVNRIFRDFCIGK